MGFLQVCDLFEFPKDFHNYKSKFHIWCFKRSSTVSTESVLEQKKNRLCLMLLINGEGKTKRKLDNTNTDDVH